MKRDITPGGREGDYLPTGEFVSLVERQHMLTHLGPIPLPPDEPFGILYPVCTNVGGFKFAGQIHKYVRPPIQWSEATRQYEFIGHRLAGGVDPVIYDHRGVLHVAPPTTSQGFAYVDPETQRLVMGDEVVSVWNGINERVYLGNGLWIGQHNRDDAPGAMLWNAVLGTHHMLEAGFCYFIRAHVKPGVEGVVSVCFAKHNVGTVRILTSLAELVRLPVWKAPGPKPPVEEPKPVSTPIPPKAWATVKALHAKFVTPETPATEEEARRFTLRCAEQMAFDDPEGGWCSKAGSPSRPPTKDCLARKKGDVFEGWDILHAAGRNGPRQLASTPIWNDLKGQHPISVVPTNHLGRVEEPPDEEPEQPPSDNENDDSIGSIKTQLALMQVRLLAIEQYLERVTGPFKSVNMMK